MWKRSVSLVAFMAVLAVFGGAYATGENVVASKAYVDKKQDKIPARETKINAEDQSFAPSVVTNGTTDGDVGQMGILTYEYLTDTKSSLDDWSDDDIIPTVGAVSDALNIIYDKIPDISNLQTKIAGYDAQNGAQSVLVDTTTDGVVAKRRIYDTSPIAVTRDNASHLVTVGAVGGSLDLKQNLIDTNMLTVRDYETRTFVLPTLVSYDATDDLTGSKYGIVDNNAQSAAANNSDMESYTIPTLGYVHNRLSEKQGKISGHSAQESDSLLTDSTTSGTVNKRAIFDGSTPYVAGTHATHIPTMGAVTTAISNNTSKITWGATQTAAVDNYSTTFNDATGHWPTADSGKLVDGTGLATALAEKQNKIAGYDAQNGESQSVLVDTTNDGVVGKMAIATAADNAGDPLSAWEGTDNMIPTVGMVEDVAQSKISARATKIEVSDTTFAPSVVTNGTTAGDVGQMAILTQARKTADGDLALDDYSNADSLIPTAAAVAEDVNYLGGTKQDKLAANNSTTFPNGSVVTYGTYGVPGQVAIANAATHNPSTGALTNGGNIATIAAVDAKQDKIVASSWQYNANNPIPGVVLSSNTNGTVNQRMLLDKTANIQNSSIANLVANGDDGNTTNGTIAFDIHDNSVSSTDVNNSVPTTKMTVAIANAAVSNKQDKIAARATKISANDTTFAPSVVTNGTTDGNVGQMAILTGARKTADDLEWDDYDSDNMIPTLGAVGHEFEKKLPYKQDRLEANNSTTYPNGSVVTYGATAGNPGQVGIYSGSTPYDATNDSGKIPTMAGVMANVPTDISSNTVNGAPLSNSASYFYGKSTSDATATTKTVSIPSITSLQDGQVIIVTPTVTNTVDSIKLKLNDFPAATIVYAGQAVGYNNSTGQRSIVWSSATPSIFAYEIVSGTGYWRFVGHGKDSNTTYTQMTVATGTAASPSSSGMVVSPATIRGVIQGTKLSDFNSAATATPVTTADTVVGSISKLQAQITDVTADIPTLPTGTSGTVVTYNGVDANNVQQYSENAIASAPVYENGTLTNPNSLATIAAVETKQTKLEANNSTTYPNGSVVTYGATAGNPGQVAIANAPAYNQSTGALTNGTDIASVAAVNTAVNAVKPVCVGWETGHENNDEYCYFWSVPE